MNADAIPSTGATLIVASHGNDLPDILQTFLTTDRDILFVANISAADFPPVRWTYAGLGVIPVSRVRDARALKERGQDASALNANAFVRVVDALNAGHCVAIFPEGVVPDAPRLGALRNGAAKMALQAIDSGVTSLRMVSVGFQYECAHVPRSGALCVIGDGVDVAKWTPVQTEKRVTEFTGFISAELQKVTRNARTWHDAEVLATVSATVGAAISSNGRQSHSRGTVVTDLEGPAPRTPITAAHQVQRLLSRLSAADGIFVAGSVAPAAVGQQAALQELERHALELSRLSAEFGARGWSARDYADVLTGAGDGSVSTHEVNPLTLLLTVPLVAVGWVWHAVPWWVSYTIAKRFAPRRVEIAAITLVPGLYVVSLWYVIAPVVLWIMGVTPWIVLPLFLAQPRLGDFAFGWRDRWRAWRLINRVCQASQAEQAAVRAAANAVRHSWRAIAP